MEILPAVIALGLMLVGLSFAVFGADGPNKLLRAVFAPIGCLLKSMALLVVILLGLLLFAGGEFEQSTRPPGEESGPSVSGSESRTDVTLEEYPLLAQRDVSLYEPAEFANEVDATLGVPVKHLACLATVYLMLERGRGTTDAMISSQTFDMDNGAVNPGYVSPDTQLDSLRVVQEIQAGRPVVLHAVGGPLGHHFVLAVGLRQGRDGSWIVQSNDPWYGERIELGLTDAEPQHPSLEGLRFTMMRLID